MGISPPSEGISDGCDVRAGAGEYYNSLQYKARTS